MGCRIDMHGGSLILEVKLLGNPEVLVDGTPLDVDTRKATAVLAYLALEGPTSRDVLMTLFWAEASPDRARATLRRTLSALRSGIGEANLKADRNQIALAGSPVVDVALLRAEIAATHEHDHDPGDVCSLCIPHLSRATETYVGDFMEGFNVRDAYLFEDWARSLAEGLRLEIGEAFNRLGHALAGAGDYSGAIRSVKRWVELDPLHEPAHRLLMLLNAWAGDRPGAIEAYRSLIGILDRELGVPPLEETTELYEAILDEDLPPAPGHRHRVRSERAVVELERGAMLGREKELAELVARARQREVGALVSIVGEPWMGKTRLIEEFGSVAERDGVDVLVARAFRSEQSLPYGVATQLLTPLVSLSEQVGSAPEWSLAELARLNPRLTPGVPPPSDTFGELRLFEAFRALVEHVGVARRIGLVVDDVQWADSSSVDLLAYLARRSADSGVLMVLAAREQEAADLPIWELLSDSDATLRLGPLTADILEGSVGSDEAASIVESTGGVPLLMVEALAGSSDGESPGVVRYLSSRMQGVSTLSRQILAAASVLNGMVDVSLLRTVSGRTEEEVVEGVEQLVGARLLAEIPETGNLRFTLDALETMAYESTSLVRRRLLHTRAAAALEGLPWARGDARLSGMIAFHHHGAGNTEASSWYELAGDLARAVYAHEEARAFYEAAMAIGGDDDGHLHLALGEVAIALANYDAAETALTIAAAHGDVDTVGRAEHRLGEVHRTLGRFDLALESFGRSLSHRPDASSVYADRALLYVRTGDLIAAREDARKSLELARASGEKTELSRSLTVLALVSEDQATALGHLDEALELAGDDAVSRMSVLNNKALFLAQRDEIDQAIGLIEEAIDLAQRTGHRHREAALHNHLADLHHQAGREDKAAGSLSAAVSLFADIDAGAWEPEIWLLRQW